MRPGSEWNKGEPYEESGKIVIIDANSGEVKESLNWAAMPSSASKPRTMNSQNQKIDAIIYTFIDCHNSFVNKHIIVRRKKK